MSVWSRRRDVNFLRSGNRVMTMSPPRVAAQYTLKRQPSTLDCAIFAQGLNRILAAGRHIAARRRQNPRRAKLPQPGNPDQESFHEFPDRDVLVNCEGNTPRSLKTPLQDMAAPIFGCLSSGGGSLCAGADRPCPRGPAAGRLTVHHPSWQNPARQHHRGQSARDRDRASRLRARHPTAIHETGASPGCAPRHCRFAWSP